MKSPFSLLTAFGIAIVAVGASAPASAQGRTFTCVCDGTKPELTGGTPTRYPGCGDGYLGGDGGRTFNGVSESFLASFLPGGEVSQLLGGIRSVYSPKSGWRCERN